MYTINTDNINHSFASENFFQSDDFYNALNKIGWKTIKIECEKPSSKACLLAFSSRKVPLYSSLFPEFNVYYGPVIDNYEKMEVIDELLFKINNQVKKCGCISLDVRTPFPYPLGSDHFHKNGFQRQITGGECSAIIDISKDTNELFRGMRRNSRRCINKAKKKRVQIKSVVDEIELKKLYYIYCNTGNRRDFTPYPYNFFRILWSEYENKKKVKFLVAVWRKKVIAGILNTYNKEESIPYIMASLSNYWDLCPNHLLVWESMIWSKEINDSSLFKLIYMPKIRDTNSSMDHYQFKSSFGGEIVEECTFYKKIISPNKYKIHNSLNKIPKWRELYNCILEKQYKY